jgi:CheY-like chemotaxis protein
MPTKILAIDDSKTMRLAIKITFAAEDADVTSVGKGSDAVARAKQVGPDVVLVDHALGDDEPSGYEVCGNLKRDPATSSIPVIVLVSNQGGVDQSQFKASGGDAWIAKPFDTTELLDKVSEVLGKPVAKPAAASAKPTTRPAAAKPKVAAAPTAKPAVAATPAPQAAPRVAAAKPRVAKSPIAAAPRPSAGKPAVVSPLTPTRPAATQHAAPGHADIPIAIPIPFTSADAPTPGILKRLQEAGSGGGGAAAGLDPKVAEALLGLSKEVIEQVVWEVVPDLAEAILKKQAAARAG